MPPSTSSSLLATKLLGETMREMNLIAEAALRESNRSFPAADYHNESSVTAMSALRNARVTIAGAFSTRNRSPGRRP
jgi:hypothetical protein